MKRKLLLVLMFCLPVFCVFAAAPTVKIAELGGNAPKIDGRMEDGEWKNAAVLNDFAAAEGLENVSVERFIQYYQEGSPTARNVMQDFTHYIGISLNTVLHTFNPDVIVINSSFTNYIPGLIDEITSGIQNRLRWYLHVLPAHLQDVSVLMGGISLCSRNFLGISTFKLLDL